MAGYNFHLKDKYSKKETPINLVIRYDKVTVKIATGQKILPKDWNHNEQKYYKSDSGYYQSNIFLSNFKHDAEEVFLTYQNINKCLPNPDELRELLKTKFDTVTKVADRPKVLDLFGFIEDFIKDAIYRKNKRNKPISPKTIQQYQLAFDKLKGYQKDKKLKELSFEQINPDFYRNYDKYLIEKYKHSQNTIANNFKMLKVFFNDAHEKGYLPNFVSKKLEIKRVESFSIYLDTSELETIHKLDLSHNKKLERVKDLFIAGCWLALRFSDLSKLTESNIKGEFIKIITQKTETPVTIPIHPMVSAILKKYEGKMPKAISNQKMNVYLKLIGKLAGIDNVVSQTKIKANEKITLNKEKYKLITTHTARRSFASNMYLMGFEARTLMQITGHKTESAFFAYIKLTRDDHAKMLKLGWEQKGIFKLA